MDQVRVVGLWGFAEYGAGLTWDRAETGSGPRRGRADAATQSRKFENKSNKMRDFRQIIL